MLGLRSLLRVLPRRLDPHLARVVRFILSCAAPGLERRIHDNLRLVYGGRLDRDARRRLAELVQANLTRFLSEFGRLEATSPAELRQRIRCYGQQHLRQALARGRGVLMVTGHYGNFELLAAYCGAYDVPITVIARAGDDDLIEQTVNQVRARHQIRVVHKSGWREALRVLRQGGVVGLLGDQAVNTGGVLTTFLGHPCSTAIGPFLLARQTGAAILPCFVTRDANDRLTAEIHRPLAPPQTDDVEQDLAAAAQQLCDIFSQQIEARPQEWYWVHRRWKTPLSLRSSAPKLSRSLALGDDS